jgi:hypothetical protein
VASAAFSCTRPTVSSSIRVDVRQLTIPLLCLLGVALSAQAPDLGALGPRVGAAVPEFGAVDQFGRAQTLQTLMGRDGLMLVFFRSADW